MHGDMIIELTWQLRKIVISLVGGQVQEDPNRQIERERERGASRDDVKESGLVPTVAEIKVQAAKERGRREQADKVVLKNHTRTKTAFLNCIIYYLLVIYKRKSSINSGEKMYGKKKYNKIIIIYD